MTIFVYISRRPKFAARPKKVLAGTPPKPSNLSWKPAQSVARARIRPRRPLWKLHWIRRRIGLRYQPNPPLPASFLPTKRAFRIKIKRAKRFVKTPRLYSIAGPPASFLPAKRAFRIKIKRARRFVRLPRLYSIAGAPASFVAFKKPPRAKIKKVRWSLRRFILGRYSIAGPPASVIPHKRFPRAKIKRKRWDLRRFAQRFYEFPGAPIISKAVEWLIRARRRGIR